MGRSRSVEPASPRRTSPSSSSPRLTLALPLPRSHSQGIDASSHVFEHLVLPHLALPRSLSAALEGAPAPGPTPASAQQVQQAVGGAQA